MNNDLLFTVYEALRGKSGFLFNEKSKIQFKCKYKEVFSCMFIMIMTQTLI